MSAPSMHDLIDELDGLSTRDLEKLAAEIARMIRERHNKGPSA